MIYDKKKFQKPFLFRSHLKNSSWIMLLQRISGQVRMICHLLWKVVTKTNNAKPWILITKSIKAQYQVIIGCKTISRTLPITTSKMDMWKDLKKRKLYHLITGKIKTVWTDRNRYWKKWTVISAMWQRHLQFILIHNLFYY